MKLNHFPFAVQNIIAVNLFVWLMAAAVLAVMVLTGAVSGDVEPIGTQVARLVEVSAIETEVASIVELPAVDTQVSSVAIVRGP